MKFKNELIEHIKIYGIIKTVVAISAVVLITGIASIFYLIEHCYNLIKGKGWTGMGLYE